jgi:hypothetical protein
MNIIVFIGFIIGGLVLSLVLFLILIEWRS